ncbi:hypothetical protein [Subtercola boreus]|uniref:IrrE N-terminal-like domain-containing protein n=1 Tax=Subtercola boreus TaxID=120213 RepID=A0A3E0W5Y0_9MICO|nr:hypothetical protein [Subtercola boreus]RFA17749.1 hypothetical protein B7R24_16520 [Subtercola boreus]RFA17778.1 hypothetical protein B7R23_16690 [Subtercola boreus]RFA24511.1 hypothetical protein B7R25_16685 [Subtercola boreus]
MTESMWKGGHDIADRCARIFEDNGLGGPRNMEELVTRVSNISGKPVMIEPLGDERWETITALWVSYPASDLVLVRATDTHLYRTHCILHELAHIIYRHPGCSDLASAEVVQSLISDGATVRGRVVNPQAVRVASERSETIEGEAENLARLLGRSLLRPRYAAGEKSFG